MLWEPGRSSVHLPSALANIETGLMQGATVHEVAILTALT